MQSVNFTKSENDRLTLTGEPWGIISYAFLQQPFFFLVKCEKHCQTVAEVSVTPSHSSVLSLDLLSVAVFTVMCLKHKSRLLCGLQWCVGLC